jgi:hypothetical protein
MEDKTNNETTAIAVVENRPRHALLRPVASAGDLIAAQKETHELIRSALEKGRDYGEIPGTDKPTLLKPGAERINLAFGVYPRYSVAEQEVDHIVEIPWKKRKWRWGEKRGEKIWEELSGTSLGLYRYVVKCELVLRGSGDVVGEGIGSCSTLESKYIDRPRDLENTVLKMAQKRAFVAATLNAYALSDRFTQDMEDVDSGPSDDQKPAATPVAAKPAPSPGGQGSGKWRFSDRFRFGDNKNKQLSESDDVALHEYANAIAKGIEQGKGYATQEHLDAVYAEIARRENGEERRGENTAAPPHDDDDIPF